MSTFTDQPSRTQGAEKLFSRVLVGVDGSPESSEAVRQAALLASPTGSRRSWQPGVSSLRSSPR